jgi:hypothetical protein
MGPATIQEQLLSLMAQVEEMKKEAGQSPEGRKLSILATQLELVQAYAEKIRA